MTESASECVHDRAVPTTSLMSSMTPTSPMGSLASSLARSRGVPLDEPLKRVRRRYHFHFPGVVYAITTVFLAIGAINSQNNLLFWAFGLAVAGMLVSGVVSGASLMGIEIARDPIVTSQVNGVMRIRYRVRNNNRIFPAFSINISERAKHGPDRDPDTRANWAGRVPEPFAFVPLIRAGETVSVEALVKPTRRGEARFRCVAVWTIFPFGLTRKSVTFVGTRVALVRPEPAEIAPNLARDRSIDGGTGRSAPLRSLDGHEFFALREYASGDSPRAIAWRRSARTGETIVRQNSAAAAERVWVELDLNDDPDLGERLIRVATAAILRASSREIVVGLSVPSQGVHAAPRDGRGHIEAMLDTLAVISSVRSREIDVGASVGASVGADASADASVRRVRPGESALVVSVQSPAGRIVQSGSLRPDAAAIRGVSEGGR